MIVNNSFCKSFTEHYKTEVPVHFTQDGTVTMQDQIYEDMSGKPSQQTEENTYTNLQLRETQPTKTSSSSNGGAQVRVVRGKTNTRVIVAITFLFTVCLILVAFALIMAGVTLSSSQETSKDSTRSSTLIESLEGQLTQLREDLQDSTQQSTRSSALIQPLESQVTQLRADLQESTRSSALIDSLTGQVTELRQELNSMRSTLAVAQHSFNTSLHTPLHPYQNCYTDTTERRMTPITGTYYTRTVVTNNLNINVTVSTILNHCY